MPRRRTAAHLSAEMPFSVPLSMVPWALPSVVKAWREMLVWTAWRHHGDPDAVVMVLCTKGIGSPHFGAEFVKDSCLTGGQNEPPPPKVTGLRHSSANARGGPGDSRCSARCAHASMLAYLALASMNSRRGGTSSPMSMEKMLSLSAAFSMVTWRNVRFSGFMVVSQSCSAFISPRPL